MSTKPLVETERQELNLILEDLRYLFDKDRIPRDEIDDVLQTLKSEEVKSYIQSLRYGSKPETALRESFIAGKSILLKYLFGEAIPEVRSNGFIDYLVKDEMGRGIVLELKPLFEAVVKLDKAGKPILEKLKQKKIVPENYAEQILKYIREGEVQFVILTNLKEWFFCSELSPKEVKYFCAISFFDFIKEYEVIGNLRDYLERKEFESIGYELDKWFLQSLKKWVGKLSEIEFNVDDKRKLELIIGLINKFIFVQTLDTHGIIEFKWIRKRWNHHERMWQRKGKAIVLEKFFGELDEWFYLYYDTELFREKILHKIEKTDENINKLYRNLQLVLGLTYLQLPFGALKGIMQYNFRFIDEDILGKAYETFLAEVRKEEGIYYTPKYITQYIAENTVGKLFDKLLAEIKEKLEEEDFENTRELVSKFTSMRILDPACGSGSFLIKAIRIIVDEYRELNQLVENCFKKYSNYMGSLDLPKEVRAKLELLSEIQKTIGPRNDRELIARILVRHIHGVDLDKRALEVAKVNIWLEAIKLTPKEFRYDRLPPDTNYILPNLTMNLCNGDSVVGLPENMTIEFLSRAHKDDIVKLYALRQKYLDNPTDPELIKKIEEIKNVLEDELNEKFKEYLKKKELPPKIFDETKPFHWPLQFWYFYFDGSGESIPENLRGTDVLIGNPPYERIQILNKKAPIYVQYLNNAGFESPFKNYDLAIIFIERGFKLLKHDGKFGYIVTQKFMQADYGEKLRSFLSEGKFVTQIVNFGDQQVFDDATTYTILLFLRNSENKTFKYCRVRWLERTVSQLMKVKNYDSLDEESLVVYTVTTDTLKSQPWIFPSPLEKNIITKLDVLPKFIEFRDKIFQGITSSGDKIFILRLRGYRDNFVKVYSKSQSREYELERDLLKPILMGKDIKKWLTREPSNIVLFPYKIENDKAQLVIEGELRTRYPRTMEYLLDNKQLLENRERGRMRGKPDWYGYIYRKNLEKYEQPKILTQVLASRASLALDENGEYYFVGGGNAGAYGILLKKRGGLSLKFTCALLNSALLDWWLKKVSTPFRGGFYSYAKRFLERLPIKLPETEGEKAIAEIIEKYVERIYSLKRGGYAVLGMWREWSTKLKNSERSLLNILIQDKENMQAGKFEKTWTSKVTFFPESDHEIMNKPFYKLEIKGDTQIPNLEIYSVGENNEEELVYEMEFGNRDLMLHVYCSLLEVLRSRAKIKTLYHLLTKTAIPIIKEVNRSPNELTPNVIKKVRNEFEGWLRQNKIENVKADIVKIDNEIEDLEAKIDALVFNLYGLEEDEEKVVFDSLKTPTIYQSKVLEFFRKL